MATAVKAKKNREQGTGSRDQKPGTPGTCMFCGCTADKACVTGGVPCSWLDDESTICSACVDAKDRDRRYAAIRTLCGIAPHFRTELLQCDVGRCAAVRLSDVGGQACVECGGIDSGLAITFAEFDRLARTPDADESPSPQPPGPAGFAGNPNSKLETRNSTTEGGELLEIPLGDIDVLPQHRAPRRETCEQLAAAIAADGLLQPIRVYRRERALKGEHAYILAFGRHRLEAFRLLKMANIPAFVFPPAALADILAVQAVENLHRADLTPWEEVEAVEHIAKQLNPIRAEGAAKLGDLVMDNGQYGTYDAERIAGMIGRTKKWVESRLALLRLSGRVRKLLGEDKINLGQAHLIARLASHEKQEEVAGRVSKQVIGYSGGEQITSLKRTAEIVEGELRSLHGVPWKLDAEFAGKVACVTCPSNTTNTPHLFADDQPKSAMCLNRECYAVKNTAANAAVRRAADKLVEMTQEGGKINAAAAQQIAPAHLSTAAVQRVARERKDRAVVSKPSKAEKKGAATAKKELTAKDRFDVAQEEWMEKVDGLVEEGVFKNAQVLAIVAMLGTTARRATAKDVEPWIKLLRGNQDLPTAAKLLHACPEKYFVQDTLQDMNELMVRALADGLELDLPPEPQLKDFQKAAEPKAAGAPKPKIQTPKSKKKAGRK